MSEDRKMTLRESILWDVHVSIRYHRRRRAFFEGFDRVTKAVGVLGGSAAITTLLGNGKTPTVIASAIVVVISTTDLVIGTGQAATRHRDLERRYLELEEEIIEAGEERFQFEKFSKKQVEIEKEEPWVLRNLAALCYNEELLRTDGASEKSHLQLKWYQRWFAHIIDIKPDLIELPDKQDDERGLARRQSNLPKFP
jgi:hypothetical protein